jgi:hypothetical protein
MYWPGLGDGYGMDMLSLSGERSVDGGGVERTGEDICMVGGSTVVHGAVAFLRLLPKIFDINSSE